MKIQSCTAKLLKYPALATLAVVAGAAMASEQPAEQKPAPPAENQESTAQSPKQVPQPSAGIVAPDTREAEPEEEEILGGDIAKPESPEEDVPVPQYFLGEIAPDAIEEVP